MISMSHKATLNTAMFAHHKRLRDSCAALRTILRSVLRRNLHDSLTGAFCLACEYADESSPCRITDRFGKMMILDQPSDVQVFNRYGVIFRQQAIAQLMKEVCALIRNFQMLARQDDSRFVAIRAAPFLLADLALRYLDCSLSLFEKARIVNHLTISKRGEVLNADIQAGGVICLWQGFGGRLRRENHEPAVRLSLDRAGLDATFKLPTQAEATGTNLTQGQLVAFEA